VSFEVVPLGPFAKQLKRLAKKFPSMKREIAVLVSELEKAPQQGTSIGHS